MAKRHLVLEVGGLQGEEHIVFLSCGVACILLLPVIEHSRVVEVVDGVFSSLGRDDLNVAVAWQKFHVWRAVKQNFARDRRQRVGQVTQLVMPMGEAAVILELAHACLLEIAAHLRLVVRVDGADVMPTWIIVGHRLNKMWIKYCGVTLTSLMLRFSWSPCAKEQASPRLQLPVS